MVRSNPRGANDPLFVPERGGPLGSSGLLQLFFRLRDIAKLRGVRCPPHSQRHTGAVMLIRASANSSSLQAMLGHTSLAMTRNYVALADADVREQHIKFSPVDTLKRRR